MSGFEFSAAPLDTALLRSALEDPACGGYASFEGWVRDLNEGRRVRHLEYEAYVELAVKEGERIVAEAVRRYGVEHARCVHRIGDLQLGELAVWVGASARHRAEAFAACRFIIDEVKHRVPIWKKEHYVDGDSGWVNCERCAAPVGAAIEGQVDASAHVHDPAHDHVHGHAQATVHAHAHDDAGAHASAHSHDHDHNREPGGARAATAATPRPDYSRQTVLREVGAAGQARLRAARVLVIGAGGLGVPVLSYLAGAGVGQLGIVDGDVLDASNLHRQTLYALDDVGRAKALLAAQRLRALNPEVDVRAHVERATAATLPALAAGYDVLVDCSDNFATKFLVNDVAVRLGKPAVLASVYQYEGQLQLVRDGGACLRCVWPEATRDGLVGNCAEAGVLGPVPGALGSLQALEVLKLLLGLPSPLADSIVLLDLLTLETRRLRAPRAAECARGACTRIDAGGAAGSSAGGAGEPATTDAEPALELHVESLASAAADGYLIVDLREAKEIALAPAPGPCLHIPLGRLLDDPTQLDVEARYLLLCARGQRSAAAAETLRRAGRPRVWSIRGGVAGFTR